jgi:hypothetical protein
MSASTVTPAAVADVIAALPVPSNEPVVPVTSPVRAVALRRCKGCSSSQPECAAVARTS